MALVEDVAARLRTQVPSRTVYEHAIPDGTLPAAYLLVRASVAGESSERFCDTIHRVDWTVRVLSIARNPDPHVAARTAAAGMTFVRDALRGWRPSGLPHRLRFATGSDPFRDESTDQTTFVVAAQYDLRTDI